MVSFLEPCAIALPENSTKAAAIRILLPLLRSLLFGWCVVMWAYMLDISPLFDCGGVFNSVIFDELEAFFSAYRLHVVIDQVIVLFNKAEFRE